MKKLALLLALALAALAVAATPALATTGLTTGDNNATVTPAGAVTGTSGNADLSSGALTITCTSTVTGDVTADGTGTFNSVAFTTCTVFGFIGCTVTVSNPSSTATADANPDTMTVHRSISGTIACADGTHCTVASPAGMVLDINDSGDPTLIDANEVFNDVTGATDCAGQVNQWTATYDATIAGVTNPTISA
jgi:hypothetical protein